MPITSFAYFGAGIPIKDPRLGDYNGTLEFYNLLRGYLPDIDLENPQPFITGSGPRTGLPTKFPLSGDAVLRFGDVDGMGNNYYPGDRRMLFSTGPVTMQPSDEQELVIALVGGLGDNYLNSVAQLKLNAANILEEYRKFFHGSPASVIELSVNSSDLTFVYMKWMFSRMKLKLNEEKKQISLCA